MSLLNNRLLPRLSKNSWLLLSSLLFFSLSGFAKEPPNLTFDKQKLIQYHDSGEYAKDLSRVVDQAMDYLTNRLAHPSSKDKKLAIVLDIDDTSLSNYPNLVNADFGGTPKDALRDRQKANDPAITPILKLYQFAKAHQVVVIFITGRIAEERSSTINNLEKVGYKDWDKLILRSQASERLPAAVYKTPQRKELSKTYDIILNIGDQYSDLRGGYAEKTFKLPNPFYFIP